jgi:hypothetical protein
MKEKTANDIEARIPVILFEEGSQIVAYSPAIDLSTCGKTEEQARKRFVESAEIFFAEIIRMGTVDEVLAEYGWSRELTPKKWKPPVYKSYVEELVPIPQGV